MSGNGVEAFEVDRCFSVWEKKRRRRRPGSGMGWGDNDPEEESAVELLKTVLSENESEAESIS